MTGKLTDSMPPCPIEHAIATAEREFACHQMRVLHDDGLYRHLRFANPTTSFYWFDVITWPGHLALSGDLGAEVWARNPDMLDFFRHDGRPDFRYWSEKRQSDASPTEFSERLVRRWVEDVLEDTDPDRADAVRSRVLNEVLDGDLAHDEQRRALYEIGELGWDGDASMEEITFQTALRLLAVQKAAQMWAERS